MSDKKHFRLISGQIVYTVDGQDEVGVITCNGITTSNGDLITKLEIDKATTALIGNFRGKMRGNPTEMTIQDVVILNIQSMGWMTDEEYNPELKPAEVAAAISEKTGLTLTASEE